MAGKYSIHVVSTPADCSFYVQQIRQHCSQHSCNAVGFDCEWLTAHQGTSRGKVAILQLASPGGLCIVVQLHRFNTWPSELLQLLGDVSIFKVGVDAVTDGQNLRSDYGIAVHGALDLRFLANYLNIAGSHGIANLSYTVLGKAVNKDWKIAASNWESPTLTSAQVQYAAEDATAGLDIFRVFRKMMQEGQMRQYVDRSFY